MKACLHPSTVTPAPVCELVEGMSEESVIPTESIGIEGFVSDSFDGDSVRPTTDGSALVPVADEAIITIQLTEDEPVNVESVEVSGDVKEYR